MRTEDDIYDAGYGLGREDGYKEGYAAGYKDAEIDFEPRLAKYYAELATLNARIDYLERFTGLNHDR